MCFQLTFGQLPHKYIYTNIHTQACVPVDGVKVARLLDHHLPAALHLEAALGAARLVAQQVLFSFRFGSPCGVVGSEHGTRWGSIDGWIRPASTYIHMYLHI